MKHYIFRDRNNGGKIVLATDAIDSREADKRFHYHFANVPRLGITVEEMECVCHSSGQCVLPHSVGEKHLIRLAPDRKPKLAPSRIPTIRLILPPHIGHKEFAHHCYYCGKDISNPRLRTKDHITPKSRGGRITCPCCHECNQLKGNLKFEEYRCIVAFRNGLIPIEILQQIRFKGEELIDLPKEE
jgi:hypothetical protein